MPNEVTIISWKPSITERENGPWHLTPSSFVAVADETLEATRSMLVEFGPDSWAGNHRHMQKELLVCLKGNLYLIWRDNKGNRHEQKMFEGNNRLQAFLIDSNIPHLMENRSEKDFGTVQVWQGISDEPILLEGRKPLLT